MSTVSLYTIGHSYCGRDNLTERLRAHGVELLVDVRSFPGSRRNPDVNTEAMRVWLPERGIQYRWEPRLGGRRKPPKERIPQDGWWRVESFANYAAHTRTHDFQAAYVELLAEASARPVAIICGEPMWWRCHRRMISDLATVDGHAVWHIMPDGSRALHQASEWACQTCA